MIISFRKTILIYMFAVLALTQTTASAELAFFDDFNTGVSSEFSGVTTTEGVQSYSGLGTGSNQFSGDFLRNSSTGNPAAASTLTLTGLSAHTSIDLNFLLAIIDSWDGNYHPSLKAPDILNVLVDGNTIFSETFDALTLAEQTYSAPPGVQLSWGSQLGFNPGNTWHIDAAYNMGLDPTFNNIAHTSSSLNVQWFASGSGWQGGNDESWALDNVEVRLNGTAVPEPSLGLLLGISFIGLVGVGAVRIIRKRKVANR